jgi:hypothetical protein
MIHMFCYGLTVGSNPSSKYCSAYVLFKEGYGLKHAAIAREIKKPVTQQQAVIMAMAMGAKALNPGRQGVMIHTNVKTLADSLNKGDFRYCANKDLLVYVTDYIRGLGRGFKAEYTPTSHPYMELAQQLAREQHDTYKS